MYRYAINAAESHALNIFTTDWACQHCGVKSVTLSTDIIHIVMIDGYEEEICDNCLKVCVTDDDSQDMTVEAYQWYLPSDELYYGIRWFAAVTCEICGTLHVPGVHDPVSTLQGYYVCNKCIHKLMLRAFIDLNPDEWNHDSDVVFEHRVTTPQNLDPSGCVTTPQNLDPSGCVTTPQNLDPSGCVTEVACNICNITSTAQYLTVVNGEVLCEYCVTKYIRTAIISFVLY